MTYSHLIVNKYVKNVYWEKIILSTNSAVKPGHPQIDRGKQTPLSQLIEESTSDGSKTLIGALKLCLFVNV